MHFERDESRVRGMPGSGNLTTVDADRALAVEAFSFEESKVRSCRQVG